MPPSNATCSMPVLLRGKPQEPSSFVRTTAKVSFQEPLPPDATWDTAMARADEFSFRVPASVAWPSATPSRSSRPSLEALARRGEAAVGGAGPQDVANVAWACARLAPSGAAPAGALGQAFHEQQLKLRDPHMHRAAGFYKRHQFLRFQQLDFRNLFHYSWVPCSIDIQVLGHVGVFQFLWTALS